MFLDDGIPVGRLRSSLVVFLAATLLFSACGGSEGRSADAGKSRTSTTRRASSADVTTTTTALSGELTVSEAASLTQAFDQISRDFEKANPDAKVKFNADSSSKLAEQIEQGAPADVFASADQDNMDRLVKDGLAPGDPITFARNQLAMVTKPGNPTGIKTLADLVDAGTISLCGSDVPCGKYAAQVLAGAGVSIPERKITRGQNATATLTAVTQGDAAAGIVYVTDALTAGKAAGQVAIPKTQNAIASYPIAVLESAKDAELAQAFVDYVTSHRGQATLREYGFLPPR